LAQKKKIAPGINFAGARSHSARARSSQTSFLDYRWPIFGRSHYKNATAHGYFAQAGSN
jgi:hypothetical protein